VAIVSFGDAKLDFGSLMAGNTASSNGGNTGSNNGGSGNTGQGSGGINFDLGNTSINLGNLAAGNSPDLKINLGGTDFNINPISGNCNIEVLKNSNVTPFVGNQFEETIAGNRLKVVLNPDDSKQIEVETSDLLVDFTYKCGELPAIKVTKDGKNYAFVVKPDEVLLQYEDNLISYAGSNHELKVEKGSNYTFMVSDDGLETDLDGYFLTAKQNEFKVGTGATYMALTDDMAAVHADDKFIELHSDDTYKVQIAQDRFIATSPNSLEVQVDSKRLYVDDTEASASDTDENFAITMTANSLAISKDDKAVAVSETEVRFDKASDYISVSADALGAKYGEYELEVTSDKEVSYKDSERQLAATPSSLYLDYQGKILEVKTDEVRLELASDQKFKVKQDLVSAQWEQYQIDLVDPLNEPAFTYSENNNSVGLSKTEVSVLIDGKGAIVGEDKLHILVDDDYLKYGEDDLSFKYGRYQADFTDWQAVNLTNGVQQFGISPTELTAAIDPQNTIKVVTDPNAPSVELVHDDTRLSIGTEKAEFDYDGMHYALGKEEYIAVHEIGDPSAGFVFTEDGIRYNFNPTDYINVAPKDDYIRLQLDNKYVAFKDDYSLQFGLDDMTATLLKDLSVEFYDGDAHRISLNKPDYMVGYTYEPLDVYLRLRRFEDNYIGLKAGMDKYGGFVKPAKDKSLEVGGFVEGLGEASITVNAKKDITGKLKNSESNFLALKIAKAKTLEKVHIRLADADLLNFGGDVDVFGEALPGVAAVGGDGPSHIATISEQAAGWAVGGVKWRYTIGKDLGFAAQGSIKSGLTIPIMCASGRFGAELGPKKVRIKMGDKSDYIKADLLCLPSFGSLFSRSGYAEFGYEVSAQEASLDVGIGYRFKVGGSGGFDVKVGLCTIGISAGFEAMVGFGGSAKLTIPMSGDETPSLNLGPLFAEMSASAHLRANACAFSIDVSAGISGRLEMEGDLNGASAEGTVKGYFKACGLSKSFDFNAKLEI